MKGNPLWSILIPTMPNRLSRFTFDLLNNLNEQIADRNIELLILCDNLKRSIGGKRNSLLHIARGKYISFIDDDDLVSSNYIEEIYNALETNKDIDLVTFDTISRPFNSNSHLCKYRVGIDPPGYMEDGVWYGVPSHLMVWKLDIATSFSFPNSNFGEDYEWMLEVGKQAKSVANIDKPLYSYEMGRSSVPEVVYAKAGDPFAS